MSTVEYFCLVTVRFPVEGGIREEVREVKPTMNVNSDSTQDLWRIAQSEAKRQVRNNRDVEDMDKIDVTGFTFWPMLLPRR